MFKRIRFRLVLVNSVVFSVILVFICAILYGFTREQVLRQIDSKLYASAHSVERGRIYSSLSGLQSGAGPAPSRLGELPTTFLVWSTHGNFVTQWPGGQFTSTEYELFRQQLNRPRPFSTTVQGHSFRVLDVPVRTETPDGAARSATVQVVRNIDETEHELSTLFGIIVGTTGVGLFMVMGAGLFLAGRALVPIRKAWERQQNFVSDASHELRTPLAVIQGQSELLLRHPKHTVEQEAGNVATIYEEAWRMRKLVDSLLTLARADSNQLELNLQTVSLSNVLNSLRDMFTLLCEQRDLSLSFDIQSDMDVVGDEDRLRQLVLILFDNAVKYSLSGGSVLVSCHLKGNAVVLEVKDTGVGISASDLPRVFDRFYRGDKARSRANGGAGLGLSIAHWIVKAHRGKISVSSAISNGTTFQVLLPVTPVMVNSRSV